jgi:hypothetical protein
MDSNFSNDEILSKAPALMPYLPEYYYNSDVTKNVLNSQAYEIGKFLVTMEEVQKQLYIDSATWGLDVWEKAYNLTPGVNDTYTDRREVLKAKIRGQGTTTKQMLKNTAESFSGGEVDIIEDSTNYLFTIKFVGAKGIPQNMAGFLNMIEDIKPAHLGYDIQYSYTVWNVIEGQNMNWNTAKTNTWDTIKTY